jgi:hypothetical protein
MKKWFLACALGLTLTVSAAFAGHPGGWGIGIMGQGGWGYGEGMLGGAALSLKAPPVPVYWGVKATAGSNYFGLGLTGDYYIIDNNFKGSGGITPGWYLGVGGFLGFSAFNASAAEWTSLSLGVRVPIGLSLLIPVSSKSFEIFAALSPNLGLGFWFWDSKYSDYWKIHGRTNFGLVSGIGAEVGIRFWF